MNAFNSICCALVVILSAVCVPYLNAGETVPKAEIERLTKALGSTDYEGRLKAQEELVDLARRFYTQLAAGLGSEDPEIRQGSVSVLRKVEKELRVSRIAARIPKEQRVALQRLSKTDPQLYNTLAHPDPAERKKACSELASLSPNFAIPVLAALAADDNRIVRNHAVHALGLTGNIQALPHLKKWVEFDDPGPGTNDQRLGAIRHVVMIKGMADKETDLQARLVSEIAVESIGKVKHADAARFLIAGLDAHPGGSFENYLDALEGTGQTDAAVAALLPKLEDTSKLSSLQPFGMVMAHFVGKATKIQPRTVGDAAFLSILRMTDQAPESYGIVAPPKNADSKAGVVKQELKLVVKANGGNEISIDGQTPQPMFPNEAARTDAIEKLKAWWRHSQKGKSVPK